MCLSLLSRWDVLLQCCSGNTAERARLDISDRGLWGPFQRTIFDFRIFHKNTDSYKEKEISSSYKLHENVKRRDYEQRVTQVEKSSFTPLVYSTTGGMGPLATVSQLRVASLVAEKW